MLNDFDKDTKATQQKNEKEATDWQKIHARHTFYKEFLSRIQKEPLPLNDNKANNPI